MGVVIVQVPSKSYPWETCLSVVLCLIFWNKRFLRRKQNNINLSLNLESESESCFLNQLSDLCLLVFFFVLFCFILFTSHCRSV